MVSAPLIWPSQAPAPDLQWVSISSFIPDGFIEMRTHFVAVENLRTVSTHLILLFRQQRGLVLVRRLWPLLQSRQLVYLPARPKRPVMVLVTEQSVYAPSISGLNPFVMTNRDLQHLLPSLFCGFLSFALIGIRAVELIIFHLFLVVTVSAIRIWASFDCGHCGEVLEAGGCKQIEVSNVNQSSRDVKSSRVC